MANNQSTKQCKHCRSDIDSRAKICPVCKKKQGGGCSTALYIFLGLVGLGAVTSILNPSDSKKPVDDTTNRAVIEATAEPTGAPAEEKATEAPKAEKTDAPKEKPTEAAAENTAAEEQATPTEAPTEAPAEAPPADDVSIGKKNALKAAENYLSFMPFSASGLVEQLEYEGYSHEDAVYASENCGADWNEQAAKAAKNYLDMMAFSRDSLIEQLVYEGFTQAQAEYGATAVGY